MSATARKYVFIPTGRQVWLALAAKLKAELHAVPVGWLGDSRLDNEAKRLFPGIDILDFSRVNYSPAEVEKIQVSDLRFILDNPRYLQTKANALKMMDRQDPYGAYRLVDREAHFHQHCLLSIHYLMKWTPDFVLMAESPHAPMQYVLFEVAKFFEVPTFSFVSWGIAPIIHIRNGISGAPIKKHIEEPHRAIEELLSSYTGQFNNKAVGVEPKYMKIQKRFDSEYQSPKLITRSIFNLIKKPRPKWPHNEKGLLPETHFFRSEKLLRHVLTNRIRRSILKELAIKSERVPDGDFVYFPLHYEPERTTTPDGIEFTDQIKALAALRALVPLDLPILVKEHYSQTSRALSGYKGRSKDFYSVATSMRNVQIVDQSTRSDELIAAAVLTATINGTAALEAACLGKSALVFGNAWYRGTPNIFHFDDIASFDCITKYKPASLIDIERHLQDTARKNCVLGCINPSNELLYQDIYQSINYTIEREISELLKLVTAAIDTVSTPC